MSELRINPLLGDWLATATERQERTFHPPPDYCPLCPTKPGGFATEVPEPTYDIVTFENKFPSFRRDPPKPAIQGSDLYAVRPAQGVCEVVLYSPDHNSTLAGLPATQYYKLILAWTDRYRELGALEFVKYVFIFENKGKEIGVTLSHPHGQIYAYPFVPPVIVKELEQCFRHREATGRCLLCDILQTEMKYGRRLVAENESFVAYVPFFARWPYEVHISPTRHRTSMLEFNSKEQRDLAAIMKQVLVAYDGVFNKSMPYMMNIHQAPTDGLPYEHYHFHIEFYPPLRQADKLKYLAGSETGAGMFINDTLAEEKAAELRALVKPVQW
jgi:UDPglucose--hexose-1-phosphate uridylyltransferase